MLLYIIEGAVPILTWLLVWAALLALRKKIPKHKKIAITHAVATWVSTALVVALVRVGFTMGDNAPKWIMDIHLAIIYSIPPLLVALMVTALKGKRKAHISLALLYLVIWTAALVTGVMIFMMARHWL